MRRKITIFFSVALTFCGLLQGDSLQAECNGTLNAETSSGIIKAGDVQAGFTEGRLPGKKAVLLSAETDLQYPLAEQYFNVNRGTLSFWFRPVAWGNGLKNSSNDFVPLFAVDQGKGKNWAYVAFVSWTSNSQLTLQVQTHGKKNAGMVYFQDKIPFTDFKPDSWSQFVITWSNMELKAYVNGHKVGSTDYGLQIEKIFDSAWKLCLFPRNFWGKQDFPSVAVSSISMRDEVLSQAEVQREYANALAIEQGVSCSVAPVPRLSNLVNIDGVISPDEWSEATRMPVAAMFGNGVFNSDLIGTVYLKYDKENFYCAFTTAEIAAQTPVLPGKMDKGIYHGSVFDFWWKPWSSPGAVCCQLGITPNGSWAFRDWENNWRYLEFDKAGGETKDGWTVEFSVPLEEMKIRPGTVFSAGFCFQRPSYLDFYNRWLSWSLMNPKIPMDMNLGQLILQPDGMSVQVSGLEDINYGKLDLHINCLNSRPVHYKITSNASLDIQTEGVLPANGLHVDDTVPSGFGALRMQIFDQEELLYNQELKYTVADPLVWESTCYASERRIECKINIRGLASKIGHRPVNCLLSLDSDGGVNYGRFSQPLQSLEEVVILPFQELPQGKYKLKIIISSENFTVTQQRDFFRPEDSFLQNPKGLERDIPPPYRPLKSTPDTLETAFLKYTFSGGFPFPSQVVSRKLDVLSKPLHFELQIDGKDELLHSVQYRICEDAPDRQRAEGILLSASGKAKILWRRTAFYDGMLKYNFTLVPKGTITVNYLRVRGLVQTECARYCLAPNYQEDWNKRGNCSAFPSLWLTGIGAGLVLFSDNDANWIFGKDDPLRARWADGSQAEITAHLIEMPVKVSAKIPYVLAMMGTPAKDPRKDWRSIHNSGWGMLRGQNLQVLMGNKPPRFMRGQDLSQPIEKNIRYWIKELNKRPAGLRHLIPYIFGDAFSNRTPVSDYYGADWIRTIDEMNLALGYQSVDVDQTPYSLLGTHCCFNKTGPADYLCYYLDQLLTEFPEFVGLYIDGGGPVRTDTPYQDTSIRPILNPGQKVRNFSVFGKRDLLERFFKIIKKHRGPSGIMFNHNWDAYQPFAVSFCDLLYPGEEFMHSIRSGLHVYVENTSLEKWQSNYNSLIHGAGIQFLGQWRFYGGDLISQPAAIRREYTKPVLMMCLLHDVPLDGCWYPDVEDTWRVLDQAQISEATFTGYWMEGADETENPHVKCSVYHWKNRKNRLLILGNLSREEQIFQSLLHGHRLRDAITGEVITFPFRLEKFFGFRLLWDQVK